RSPPGTRPAPPRTRAPAPRPAYQPSPSVPPGPFVSSCRNPHAGARGSNPERPGGSRQRPAAARTPRFRPPARHAGRGDSGGSRAPGPDGDFAPGLEPLTRTAEVGPLRDVGGHQHPGHDRPVPPELAAVQAERAFKPLVDPAMNRE